MDMTGVQIHHGSPSTGDKILEQGGAIQKVETQYHTAIAVQKPRNIGQVAQNVLAEAAHAGDAFYYSYPVKGKQIEGPTIGLAMAIAREMGNCAVDVDHEKVGDTDIFTATYVDVEKGFTIRRIFRSKQKAFGGKNTKYTDERGEAQMFQVKQSKAIRNVVIAAAPKWLVNQAIETAKNAAINNIDRSGLYEAATQTCDYFARLGIPAQTLEAHLDKPLAQWTKEDVAFLRNIARQVNDGEIDPMSVFCDNNRYRQQEPPPPPPAPEPEPVFAPVEQDVTAPNYNAEADIDQIIPAAVEEPAAHCTLCSKPIVSTHKGQRICKCNTAIGKDQGWESRLFKVYTAFNPDGSMSYEEWVSATMSCTPDKVTRKQVIDFEKEL